MKSKLEARIDAEFERLGVKPYVYHVPVTNTFEFNNVTIAVETRIKPDVVQSHVDGCVCFALMDEHNHTRRFFHAMKTGYGIYGIAICDHRDQFNRKRGRIIAKGRLLKYLKECKGE